MVRNNAGFTYIELVIVIFTVSILAYMGTASYLNLNVRKDAEAETKKLVEYLDIARNKTQAQDKACPDYTGSYTVSLNGSVMSLTPVGCSATATYTFGDQYAFPQGDFTVAFQPLGAGATGDSCILLDHTTADVCGKVTITAGGTVEYAVTNSAGCVCP